MKSCSLVELSSWEREFEAQRGSDECWLAQPEKDLTPREGPAKM